MSDEQASVVTSSAAVNKEQALRTRFEAILHLAPAGLFETDTVGNCLYVNNAWSQIAGLSEEEAMGDGWSAAIHPDDRDAVFREWGEAATQGRPFSLQYRFRNVKTGEVFFVHGRSQALYDEQGELSGYLGAVVDRSEQHALEREIEFVLQSNAIGVWRYLVAEDRLIWDEGMLQIYGDSAESQPANLAAWLSRIPRNELTRVSEQVTAVLRQGDTLDTVFSTRTSSGDQRFMHLRAGVERDDAGNATQLFGINTDVTETELAKLEAARNARLAQHQSKLASIGELAAGVGHEINNPLTIAKGYLDSIRETSQGAELSPQLNRMDAALERISKIVHGLRRYARSDEEQLSHFSPSASLHQTLELIEEIYRNSGVALTVDDDAAEKPVRLWGDEGKFQQIVMNLVSNAKHAVTESSAPEIILRLSHDDARVRLQVTDNGCGIAQDTLSRIFDPFFTTKDMEHGTGMGLSMTHQFVTEMDGTIDVATTPGAGTSFVLTFPIAPAADAPAPAPPSESPDSPASAQQVAPKHILVVDDEPDIRSLLVLYLESMGHTAESAQDGREALETYLSADKRFDMVISDMQMPRMTGRELLHELHEHSHGPPPKFVVITGGEPGAMAPTETVSPDDYLLKPFTVQDLHDQLARLFNR